jgi:hypothetical protein
MRILPTALASHNDFITLVAFKFTLSQAASAHTLDRELHLSMLLV